MKPPKPRITKKHLHWKLERGLWTPYHRSTWTVDGKRKERAIKLDWQGDPEELDRLFWLCETGKHDRQAVPAKYSWRNLIIAWRKDPRVQKKLADGTKRSYRQVMDVLMEKNGQKDIRMTTRKGLRAVHDKLSETPRKADKYLQTVSLLWNYGAKKLDWPLGDNPASGIDHYGKQREFEPWPEWLIEKLQDAPDTVRRVATLILCTGQRPSAAISMRYDQFNGEWMTVVDEKNDVEITVYCPDDLRAYIATLSRKGAHILAKNLTEPLGYNAAEKSFRRWRDSMGDAARAYSLHGLRKLSIIRLAEAGCSDAEIQAVTGQSAEMVAYYRAKASRRKLSMTAQKRRT